MFLYLSSGCIFDDWLNEVLLELGCGLLVAVVIFLLLEQAVGARIRQADSFRSLIHDLHSEDQAVRTIAAEEMSLNAWWRGADLHLVNLSGALLPGKDFAGANLRGANLFGVDMVGANLQKCNLRFANLQGGQLLNANLRLSDLRGADFHGAILRGADLRGAKYDEHDLEGADCEGVLR